MLVVLLTRTSCCCCFCCLEEVADCCRKQFSGTTVDVEPAAARGCAEDMENEEEDGDVRTEAVEFAEPASVSGGTGVDEAEEVKAPEGDGRELAKEEARGTEDEVSDEVSASLRVLSWCFCASPAPVFENAGKRICAADILCGEGVCLVGVVLLSTADGKDEAEKEEDEASLSRAAKYAAAACGTRLREEESGELGADCVPVGCVESAGHADEGVLAPGVEAEGESALRFVFSAKCPHSARSATLVGMRRRSSRRTAS